MTEIELWQRPSDSKNIFGEDEKFWYYCGAGKTIADLLEKKDIPKGATIRVITNDFREDKWGFDSAWYKFVKTKLDEGIKIKAYGGQNRMASEAVQKLMDAKMDVFEVSAEPGKEPIKEHYVTVDNPPVIWAEAEHRGFYAFGCFYTEKPYEDAWFGIDKYFEDIEKQGKWLPHKSPSEMASNKREEIAEIVYDLSSGDRDSFIDEYKLDIRKSRTWDELTKSSREFWVERVSKILSIKGIRLEAENQELPDNPYSDLSLFVAYGVAVGHILTPDSEGRVWVKCLKKEEHGS